MEIRSLQLTDSAFELIEEERENGKSFRMSGYASVFYDANEPGTQFTLAPGIVERIDKSAFERALHENDDVVALVNHNSNRALARTVAGTLRLTTDKKGLRYDMDVIDNSVGRDAVAEARAGLLRGSSFAFFAEKAVWSEEKGLDVRTIKQVRLVDVGPVLHPAYPATTVSTGRSLDSHERTWQDEREYWRKHKSQEAALRRDIYLLRTRLAEIL